jgi:hypothetical protein
VISAIKQYKQFQESLCLLRKHHPSNPAVVLRCLVSKLLMSFEDFMTVNVKIKLFCDACCVM